MAAEHPGGLVLSGTREAVLIPVSAGVAPCAVMMWQGWGSLRDAVLHALVARPPGLRPRRSSAMRSPLADTQQQALSAG